MDEKSMDHLPQMHVFDIVEMKNKLTGFRSVPE